MDSNIAQTKQVFYDPIHDSNRTLCRDYLLEPLSSAAQEMEIPIKNNIQLHFFKRQNKYLRTLHSDKNKKEVWDIQNLLNNSQKRDDTTICFPLKSKEM